MAPASCIGPVETIARHRYWRHTLNEDWRGRDSQRRIPTVIHEMLEGRLKTKGEALTLAKPRRRGSPNSHPNL